LLFFFKDELADEEGGRFFDFFDEVFVFSSDFVGFLGDFSSESEDEEEDSVFLTFFRFWEDFRSSLEVERIDDDDFFNFVVVFSIFLMKFLYFLQILWVF